MIKITECMCLCSFLKVLISEITCENGQEQRIKCHRGCGPQTKRTNNKRNIRHGRLLSNLSVRGGQNSSSHNEKPIKFTLQAAAKVENVKIPYYFENIVKRSDWKQLEECLLRNADSFLNVCIGQLPFTKTCSNIWSLPKQMQNQKCPSGMKGCLRCSS